MRSATNFDPDVDPVPGLFDLAGTLDGGFHPLGESLDLVAPQTFGSFEQIGQFLLDIFDRAGGDAEAGLEPALGIGAGDDEFMGAGDRPAGRHDVELHLDPIAAKSGGNRPQGVTPFQSVRYFRHLATIFSCNTPVIMGNPLAGSPRIVCGAPDINHRECAKRRRRTCFFQCRLLIK